MIGETDDFSYNIASDPVHVHDLQATILHLMGIDRLASSSDLSSLDYRQIPRRFAAACCG